MELVSEWRRKTLGAVSASLLLPIVLLFAAAAVASGGNLGGLGSLTQAVSGPSLPETGAPEQEISLADAGVVGADVPAAEARAAASAAATSGGGGDVALAQAAPSSGPSTPVVTPPPASTPGLPPAPPATVAEPAPTAGPGPLPPAQRTPTDEGSPNLVQEVIDTARGLVGGLPIVGPLTDDVLDLLLGPQP